MSFDKRVFEICILFPYFIVFYLKTGLLYVYLMELKLFWSLHKHSLAMSLLTIYYVTCWETVGSWDGSSWNVEHGTEHGTKHGTDWLEFMWNSYLTEMQNSLQERVNEMRSKLWLQTQMQSRCDWSREQNWLKYKKILIRDQDKYWQTKFSGGGTF